MKDKATWQGHGVTYQSRGFKMLQSMTERLKWKRRVERLGFGKLQVVTLSMEFVIYLSHWTGN